MGCGCRDFQLLELEVLVYGQEAVELKRSLGEKLSVLDT